MASIRKRGKSYQITVSNGRDIHDKQILKTATWTPNPNKTEKQNQKALERFAMDFEDRVKNGKYLNGEKLTFREFTDQWFNEYAIMQLEPTTTEVYRFLLDAHVIPEIGHLKLAKVQPAHLNKLYSLLLKERNIDIRTVSNRLGHAQTSTTMNIYTHALQKKDEQAAQTLEKLLIQKPC